MTSSKASSFAEILAVGLQTSSHQVEATLSNLSSNVHVVLQRQLSRSLSDAGPYTDKPICKIEGEEQFLEALRTTDLGEALFTLARVYDAGHIVLCKNRTLALRGKPHNENLLKNPILDVHELLQLIGLGHDYRNSEVRLRLEDEGSNILKAEWTPVIPMSFDHLPKLESLGGLLPGETSAGQSYAGIGGGGGSDVVSASLLGHLLRRSGKEMNLLISTRTWRTGSQGAKGSKMGVKREIHEHGGPAVLNDKPVPGTYRVTRDTFSEGRDLETVPINHHEEIYIVLDQGEEGNGIRPEDRSELEQQFHAVLTQHKAPDTVIVVDTGGDVFGADSVTFSTPDQDLRVQRAFAHLSDTYPNLVTAVLAPGVDAPSNAPQKAQMASGQRYQPNDEEKALLLELLVQEYQMDGSVPARFGKTSLCLQEALKGKRGWACLNLPGHVVDTWDNPWSCFVYIRECMTDIILMPLQSLLPLIDG